MGRKSGNTNTVSNSGYDTDNSIGNSENPDTEYNGTGETGDNTITGNIETNTTDTSSTTDTSTNTEPTRKRGRPKKEQTTFSVQEKEVKKGKGRGRPVKGDERKLYTKEESVALTGVILSLVEGLATSSLGNEAAFKPIEKTLLQEGLPPMLERMSVSAAEKTANIMYPAMIGFAAVSYGIRVLKIVKDKNEKSNYYPPSYEQTEGTFLDNDDKPENNSNNNDGSSFHPGTDLFNGLNI